MMNLDRWEAFCRRQGTIPMGARTTKHGVIYVAEGLHAPEEVPIEDFRGIDTKWHYKVYWAVSRDGLDMGSVIAVSTKLSDKERFEEGIKAGEEWIRMNLDHRRYH